MPGSPARPPAPCRPSSSTAKRNSRPRIGSIPCSSRRSRPRCRGISRCMASPCRARRRRCARCTATRKRRGCSPRSRRFTSRSVIFSAARSRARSLCRAPVRTLAHGRGRSRPGAPRDRRQARHGGRARGAQGASALAGRGPRLRLVARAGEPPGRRVRGPGPAHLERSRRVEPAHAREPDAVGVDRDRRDRPRLPGGEGAAQPEDVAVAELAALQISVSADAATQQVKQFGEAAGKMGTQAEAGAQKAVRAFKELAGAVGIGFGIYEAAKLFKEFVAVNVEAEDATAQLTAALKASGAASGQTIATLKAHASALQQLSTFDDEAVQRAQALLLTFDKIRGETFPGATQAVLDLATRMGGDLQGAALQVGKALQDPEHGLLALRRAGVSFSEAQQEIIKNLFATGHAAEGQALILKELTHEFGGSAAAARETLGGAIKGLENDFKDLLEQTSRTSGPVVGFLNAMAAGLRAVNEAVSDPSSIEGLKKRIAALQASISNSALDPRQHAQFIQPQIDVYKQQLATLEGSL